MLSVKHGGFNDLEVAFIERLRELAKEVPTNVAVVAPSRRMADRLERLAAVENGLPLLGVQFHTFHSLATAIVAAEGFPDKALISDPVFHERLVDRILEELPGLAAFFGGQARPRALAAALRSSLKDLVDAGVRAEELEEHFGSELLREAHDRERLGALLALARAYERRLEKLGLLSSAGLTKLAAARSGTSALLAGFKEVLYYGFYDLTGLQLEFFEAVSAARPATLFFPHREGHPAFKFAQPFFDEKLRAHPAQAVAGGRAPALGPALDHLFGPGSAGLPEGRLSIVSASGARDEAWAAAKEILRLTDAGTRAEDIGVVARTLEPYRAAIVEAFGENAIPCDLGAGEPLLGQPLAKCALNLLSLKRADFPAATVEDLFGSPYFAGGAARSARHWRQAIRFLGIRAGWLQWRGKLEGRLGEDLELAPDYKIPKEDLKSLWELVSGLERALSEGEASWSGLAKRALAILDQKLALPEAPSAAESAAWEAVRAQIASLAEFDRLGEKPTWDDFLECLEAKLKRAVIDVASGARGVRVMDAMDARGQSFKALVLLGLKEKLFPRLVVEDPLLREPARAALKHPAGYWIGLKSAGYEEERLLFYLAAAAASERVLCVYPRSDEAGKAQVPSLYLRELCRAARQPLSEEGGRVPRQPAERLQDCEPNLLTEKELSLRRAFDGVLPEGDARRVAELNRAGAPGASDGVVGPPEEHLKRLRVEGLSPSAMDELAQCPFRYFAGRVLGLATRDAGAEKGEFAAWVRGEIYHAVLERFFAQAADARWEKRLDASVDAVFAEYDWKRMGVYPLLWLSAKQTMGARLREFVAWDLARQNESGMRPLWREKELRGAWPGPLPGALAGTPARGIADRIDADEARRRLRIVDYKTRWGSKGRVPKLVSEGVLHQLPLYAELALEAAPGAEILDAAIYALEDPPEERARVLPGKEWALMREAFFKLAAERLAKAAEGRFPIKPDDGEFGYCRFCEFSGACRKSHGPSRRRAAAA